MNAKHLLLLALLPLMIFVVGCKEDSTSPSETPINEAQTLVQYLESSGDYINTTATSIVAATTVQTNLSAGTQYVIDIRDSAAYNLGHIPGAVRVTFANLPTHVASVPTSYTSIVIACYSGQTAAYATSLLRLSGYNRVASMKFGMSAWDSVFAATAWLSSGKMSNARATQFVTTATAKNAKGNLPTISTGKTTGAEILQARVSAAWSGGFSPAATVDNTTLFNNLSTYYIVNYWPVAEYNAGHVPGAIQYLKPDMRDTAFLRTLPTDKPIAIYCYTGQTSAFLAAYLRLLGYDAKSLLYGANSMIYDIMPGTKFVPATEIKGYAYNTGNTP
ncbi:MAG: rhodanese-like domain-containing protein [Bacteroidetes bacterium]|jgi:rhodanese-related sulfurtransferase|nr:rhodanese-like domain-containing protein [Bacteroidota bacterium]